MKLIALILIHAASVAIAAGAEISDSIISETTVAENSVAKTVFTETALDSIKSRGTETDNRPFSNIYVQGGLKVNPRFTDIYTGKETEPVDTTNMNWWYLFRHGRLNLKDNRVEWPGFLGFCVKVYNWGDRTFNTYDPEYVVGTGKRWKARLLNDVWNDSYLINTGKKNQILMVSNPYIHTGASLQYMAVSYTYLVDMSNLIWNKPTNHRKQEFSFTCALFSASLRYFENTGGTTIRRFGDYNNGKHLNIEFPGLKFSTLSVDAYFIKNHKRYSQGAAYSFAKIQKKSAGSCLFGFSYSKQNIRFDFNKLPPPLLEYSSRLERIMKFHYNDYILSVGYGHNFVAGKKCLFNVTALPGVGFNHCYEDSQDGKSTMFSFNGRGMASFTFNHRQMFVGLSGTLLFQTYLSNRYRFVSTILDISSSIGIRF